MFNKSDRLFLLWRLGNGGGGGARLVLQGRGGFLRGQGRQRGGPQGEAQERQRRNLF